MSDPARVTANDVQGIIDYDSKISMVPFIAIATALTDKVSSNDSDSVLSTALLKEIERNLAAHFYAHRDLQYHSKKTGDASGDFQGKTEMGLDSTLWGQTAKLLDLTGFLNNLDKSDRPKASLSWLGLPPSGQTDYVDRD